MSYYDKLSSQQKKNVEFLIDEARKGGITNENSIAALLSIISKETGFIPKSEELQNYTPSRIVKVYNLPLEKAKTLAGNPIALANAVYGGKYGNAPNEGFKYRGRGYNQLTFKGNYALYGKQIGVDLVNNPDLANDPQIAAKIAIAFAKNGINDLKKKGKLSAYNANDINDFKNTTDATLAFYHANAGTGKSVSSIKSLQQSDALGGMKTALSNVNDLLVKVKNFVGKAVGKAKENPLMTVILTTFVVVSGYVVLKHLKIL